MFIYYIATILQTKKCKNIDLEYKQNEEVSICYSLELFKQVFWQET